MKVLPDHSNLQIHVLDERFYLSPTKENTYYPGVTTILDAYPKDHAYYEWLKTVGLNADVVRDRAAEQGSTVHNLINRFLVGDPVIWDDSISLDEWIGFCRFQEFYWRYQPETIFTEKIVVTDEYKYGGQLDYGARFVSESDNGENNWLIDFKFTNSLRKTHALQLVAYKRMVEEFFKIDRIGILHLKADTRKDNELQGKGWKLYEIKPDKWEHNLKLFDYTHSLWKEENQNFKPKNKIYPMSFAIGEQPDKDLLYGIKGSNNSAD